MIVKDEARHLPGCLACIAPVVDEMVIVDTGSSDDTVAIARRYGAEIHHFPWIDDFAAARNESIRYARGRYILWLDADDRMAPEDIDKINTLKKGFPVDGTEAYALQIECRNSLGEGVVYNQLRIFPNIDGICFEGAVHEEIVPSLHEQGIGIHRRDIAVLHIGYTDLEVLNEKSKRNIGILLKIQAASGLSADDRAKLAACYFTMQAYNQCIEHLLLARTQGGPSARFYKKSHVTLADCYIQTGQGDAAVALLEAALSEDPDHWYLQYLLGAALVLTENSGNALPYLRSALSAPRRIEDFPVLTHVDARLHYFIGRCYEANSLLEKAKEAYDKSLAIMPHDFDALRACGFTAARLGKVEAAMERFMTALTRTPRLDRGVWLALAGIYRFLGDDPAAADLYQEVLETDPTDGDALCGMEHLARKAIPNEHT